MAIIWPCPLSPAHYAAAGQQIVVPVQHCPTCAVALVGWGGYWRWVRIPRSVEQRLWIRRGWCGGCHRTQAYLPAFLLVRRLDVTTSIGVVLAGVTGGAGVRPIAQQVDVPHTTARGWWRRFRARAAALLPPLLALATSLDVASVPLPAPATRAALVLAALAATWQRARQRLGDRVPTVWPFWSLVSGGLALAPHTSAPYRARGAAGWMAASP